MQTLEERFNEFKEKKPRWSDFLCLSNAVLARGFTFEQIRSAFDSLLSPKDYSLSDRDEILQDLYQKTLLGHA